MHQKNYLTPCYPVLPDHPTPPPNGFYQIYQLIDGSVYLLGSGAKTAPISLDGGVVQSVKQLAPGDTLWAADENSADSVESFNMVFGDRRAEFATRRKSVTFNKGELQAGREGWDKTTVIEDGVSMTRITGVILTEPNKDLYSVSLTTHFDGDRFRVRVRDDHGGRPNFYGGVFDPSITYSKVPTAAAGLAAVKLSQADYDALPATEKEDSTKLYLIV